MVHSLRHVTIITSQRDRGLLEEDIGRAMQELLGVARVTIWHLYKTGTGQQIGTTTWVDASGAHCFDDDLFWPDNIAPLADYPLLRQVFDSGALASGTLSTGAFGTALAISRGRQIFAIAEIEHAEPLSHSQTEMACHLAALYSHCLAMLDYSEIDTLTGLLNRKTFDDKLIKILTRLNSRGDSALPDRATMPRRRRGHGEGEEHWLAVMDIDHFKRVNDTYGHLIGDEVLLLVATLMKHSFRGEDKLFRFGGEEFVVLLKPAKRDDAFNVFERFRKTIGEYQFPQIGQITISIGFTHITAQDSPTVVLEAADEALYYAKANGRNQVCHYDQLIAEGKIAVKESISGEIELF
jgi:diguanylate cyclase (GGDEF)-like protein